MDEYEAPGIDRRVTPAEIRQVIRKIKTGEATGLDHISVGLLKTIADDDHVMIEHHSKIVTWVLMTGEMPEEWQKAVVRQIYRSGDRRDWVNYRLIRLISVAGKLFEAVIASRINDAFEEYNIFTDYQFGFRRGRSCALAQYSLWKQSRSELAKEKNTFCAFS